jgi:hypothetical protein
LLILSLVEIEEGRRWEHLGQVIHPAKAPALFRRTLNTPVEVDHSQSIAAIDNNFHWSKKYPFYFNLLVDSLNFFPYLLADIIRPPFYLSHQSQHTLSFNVQALALAPAMSHQISTSLFTTSSLQYLG